MPSFDNFIAPKIRFERTRDFELIAKIFTHPKLYPSLTDDFAPAPENWWPLDSPALFHLLVFDTETGDLLGMYITHPINPRLWEVHHALLPHAWGKKALEIGRAFEHWLWENTDAETVIGFTPADNRLALRYARQLGMTECGRISRAVQRRGELHDITIFQKHRT